MDTNHPSFLQEWGPIISPFVATLIIYIQIRTQQIRTMLDQESNKRALETIHIAVNSAKSEADRVQAESVRNASMLVESKLALATENERLKEKIRGMELAAAKIPQLPMSPPAEPPAK